MSENLPTIQTVADSFVFQTAQNFEVGQRMAMALAKSSIVPKEYQGNVPNCLIGLEISQRLKASPLLIMQNLHIIHGRPSWSAQFLIATINSCGRYSPLRFVITRETEAREINNVKIVNITCVAWAIEKETGERLESSAVSLEMAIQEGWYTKNGSKWKTMPEQMLRYRAASFFARIYSPELTMGMYTIEEAQDMGLKDVTPTKNTSAAAELNKEFLNIDPDVDGETGEVVPSTSTNPEVEEAPKELPPIPTIKIGTNEDGTANWQQFADDLTRAAELCNDEYWRNKLVKAHESPMKNLAKAKPELYESVVAHLGF